MGLWNNIKLFFGFEGDASAPEIAISEPTSPTFAKQKHKPTRQSVASIRIESPRIYEDSLTVGNYLRDGVPVIVLLTHLDADVGKRLIDFVCGTTYAINGAMQKIGDGIFLFVPPGVVISDTGESAPETTQANPTALHALNQLQ
jgi:FtsZ-interacting cell division protein YlmF